MRWSRALAAPVLMLFVVVACSSPGASTSSGDDGGNGSDQSQAAEPTPEATSEDGDNGGDGGSGSEDADAAYEALIPPNSQEVTKTTAEGVIFAAFTSTDSVDSLTSFYQDAFDDLGLQILTTTETSGGISLVRSARTRMRASSAASFRSSPKPNGYGSQISVQIGTTN